MLKIIIYKNHVSIFISILFNLMHVVTIGIRGLSYLGGPAWPDGWVVITWYPTSKEKVYLFLNSAFHVFGDFNRISKFSTLFRSCFIVFPHFFGFR